MHQWILYDYYTREKETDEVMDLICKLLNIKADNKAKIFKQNEPQKHNH